MTFAKRCLAEADVVFIPGVGFGPPGEGYFRAALTVETDRIAAGPGAAGQAEVVKPGATETSSQSPVASSSGRGDGS